MTEASWCPRFRFTSVADGDLSVGGEAPELAARRRAVIDLPWTWLHQVHGAEVVVIDAPGARAGAWADAMVTNVAGAVLAVHTADCGPLALLADGVVAAVHVGWRGLSEGVVAGAVDAMRALGAGAIRAELGPCIRARCYEFGAEDLEVVASVVGDGVRSVTAWGAPALDLSAGIAVALADVGISDLGDSGVCTACSSRHWSHRARGDTGRQAVAVWLEP